MRIEEDCIGKLALPDEVLYGIHTKRALGNFKIDSEAISPLVIRNLVLIKRAAAQTNCEAQTLPAERALAIEQACDAILLHHYDDQFVVPAIQGGAGTSTNMNVNEVIANVANQYLALHERMHPNDDVNQAQSTNDTFPTACKMAALQLLPALKQQLKHLSDSWLRKAFEYDDALKLGRTQLQDAMPTTFGQSFRVYASLFKRDLVRINRASQNLTTVNMGGTAIGTGVNASQYYQQHIVTAINRVAHLNLTQATNLIDATQNCDSFAEFSGALKVLAVDLNKMANDLRLLSSGPRAGLSELKLPARQAGSSIMPGKVNPVLPEFINQVAFEVIGHDTTITLAAEAGQLELNAFEPVMIRDLLSSMTLLTGAIQRFIQNCLTDLTVDRETGAQAVEASPVIATVLSPLIGYQQTTALVHEATDTGQTIRELLLQKHLFRPAQIEQLLAPASLLGRPSSHKNQVVNH
ncbi:aspartate ammonia-lyase [Loigolactobacillus bifermentans]|uniref:aspartate ammonia-lyase n=1 Tax=Loigolactobacillus bifermentans TaxID=1607 RepID=UPI00070AEBDE|nr:aspartate ammonia-lyase [Loigolactobacillus bifermentans]QGG59897.1 aspartate ammonia-lyase [Loigolactobacillus bifermentans]